MLNNPPRLSQRQQREAREKLDNFATTTPGVRHALLVSSDGLLLHSTGALDVAKAESLAAVTSGLLSNGRAAGEQIDENRCEQMMARYAGAYLLFETVTELAGLVVVVNRGAKLDVVAAAMTRLVESTGRVLAPNVRDDVTAGPPPTGEMRP